MSTLHEAAESLRISYRVKLEGERTWYVDIMASSHEEATRIALDRYSRACSARCIGPTPKVGT